jgi:L-threonylcarbamoyladenylate synthase
MGLTSALDLSGTKWERYEQTVLVEHALANLRSGRIVAAPTDTVYGLLAMASSSEAIDAVFQLKARPRERALPVLVQGTSQAIEACRVINGRSKDRMEELAELFWPGALTMVVSAEANPITTNVSDGSSIAVRAPDDELLRSLLTAEPLVGTSANLHGQPPGSGGLEVVNGLMGESGRSLKYLYEIGLGLVIDGRPGGSQSSTVVDLRGELPVILRDGPISSSDISDALRLPSRRRTESS